MARALCLLLIMPSLGEAAVYKCTEGGQVVFTDRPCVYTAPAVKAEAKPVPPANRSDEARLAPRREVAASVPGPR